VRRVLLNGVLAIAGVAWVGFLLFVLLLVSGTLKAYAIPSSAMEPTLHCARPVPGCEAGHKDRVLALTRLVSYDRGDLVVFDAPPAAERECGAGGKFVKRIVGLPGERVETRLEGGLSHVYVDGRRLEEPYVEDERRDLAPEQQFRVPEGSYFMLGDNRPQSCDSRVFGPVPEEYRIGELVATYWPPNRITFR
jgi:signal peptidase I